MDLQIFVSILWAVVPESLTG